MTWAARYFTLDELTRSDTAARHGIDNLPTGDALANLTATAIKMDAVRELLGYPVHVNSGFRSPALNKIVGGSPTSAHSLGLAVDFTCSGFGSPLDV